MSENIDAISELRRYLGSVADLYPGQIPEQFLDRTELWGTATAKLVFVGCFSTPERPYSGEDGELLMNAIEKGLKLSLADVAVIAHADGAELAKDALANFSNDCEVVALGAAVLGSSERRGSRVNWDGISIRVTHSLNQVLNGKQAKREFWVDLQELV